MNLGLHWGQEYTWEHACGDDQGNVLHVQIIVIFGPSDQDYLVADKVSIL